MAMVELPFARVWPSVVQVPLETRLRVRHLYRRWQESDWPWDAELFNVGTEVWCNRGGVPEHVDSCNEMFTHGLVLCGHPQLVLHADGLRMPLPTGSVYRLIGERPHSVEAGREDLFLAFLAWDLPFEEEATVGEFAQEALASAVHTVDWGWTMAQEVWMEEGIVRRVQG